MKKTVYLVVILTVIFTACLGLVGCDSSSDGDSDTSSTTPESTRVNGKVADGYLHEAKVCLDTNLNGRCDSNETSTLSQNGDYELTINATDKNKYPIIVEAIAGETIDLDDRRYVEDSYCMTAPKDNPQFISPITTLIKGEKEKNPALTTGEAASIVSRTLGVTEEKSKLLEDYVATESTDSVFKKLHEVGKVVVRLNVDINAELATSLGAPESPEQEAGFSYIVNDITMRNIKTISSKIQNANKEASELATDISTVVDNVNVSRNDLVSAAKNRALKRSAKAADITETLGDYLFVFEGDEHGSQLNATIFKDGVVKDSYEDVTRTTDYAISRAKPIAGGVLETLDNGSLKLTHPGDDNDYITAHGPYNVTLTVDRAIRLDLSLTPYTFKELLDLMQENDSGVIRDLKKSVGDADLESKYDSEITFDKGDYMVIFMHLRVDPSEAEEAGEPEYSAAYVFNESAMSKILEVLHR